MAVASNPTSTSNTSWFDSFWGGISNIGATAGALWLQYQDQKTKAQVEKIQAQNTALLGKEQLAAWESQQSKANLLLWGVLIVGTIFGVLILKKLLKKV